MRAVMVTAMEISEPDIVELLRHAGRRLAGTGSDELDYEVDVVGAEDGHVELELRQFGQSARLVVPLRSAARPLQWLYREPDDAADWALQFLIWLDEEMFTGGLGPSSGRVERGGHAYLIIARYGFRSSDIRDRCCGA